MNFKLLKYLKPYWFFALMSPIMMFLEVAVDLSQPTLMSTIVDDGVLAGNMGVIYSTGIKMLILVILGGITGIAASYFSNMAAQSFSCDLRNAAFQKVMNLSLEQTDKFTTGSLVTRLTNDITMVQHFVGMALRMFIRAPLSFIGGIFMALTLNVKFSVVLMCALPLEILMIVLVMRKATPLFSVVQKKLDRVNSVVQENITGARVVKAYVREEHEIDRFAQSNEELCQTTFKVQKFMAILSPVMMIIMNLSVIAIIYIGGFEVQAANMDVGKIMAAITYITQILMSLMMVSMMFQHISRANASAKRITEMLDSDPVIASGSYNKKEGSGAVSFKNVSFHYPGTVGRPVLEGVDLDIKPGEFVAVLGSTGSGKTSLVNLIPRFYDVNDGEVTVDGVDVREYNLDTLRSKISVVLQKSEIFSGSIIDNIRWGKPDATDDEVKKAADIAQASEFIESFTDGYDTYIGEKGASLSGGQKQRLSIARALVRNPEIIIFDDSSSALDVGTEAKLRSALRERMSETTVIMIAQRISSVMHADRIAVLDNGRISAVGTHEELMKNSAIYLDIYNSQMKNSEGGEA